MKYATNTVAIGQNPWSVAAIAEYSVISVPKLGFKILADFMVALRSETEVDTTNIARRFREFAYVRGTLTKPGDQRLGL